MHRASRAALLWGLLVLAACNDGDSGGSGIGASVAPVAATGSSCVGIYGDPPAAMTSSISALSNQAVQLLQLCSLRGGELLTFTDPDGTARQACLHVPPQASRDKPLPLVTFLQGSILPADPQTLITGWEFVNATTDLTGDASRNGFILLVPFGRDTHHFYPFPDDSGLGWDHWYRNVDRSSASVNVDVATIDHFIKMVRDRGLVDDKRLFMSGVSNGGAMAILYALNTPGIAASVVYTNPDPFSDITDPCAQLPFGNNLRPIMDIHNDCDIGSLCQTGGESLEEKFSILMPQLVSRSVIIDALQGETSSCDGACTYDGTPLSILSPGTLRHFIWPYLWNDRMFAFLREHPLP